MASNAPTEGITINMGWLSGIERLCWRITGCIEALDTPGGTPNWKMSGILKASASTASLSSVLWYGPWPRTHSGGRGGLFLRIQGADCPSRLYIDGWEDTVLHAGVEEPTRRRWSTMPRMDSISCPSDPPPGFFRCAR